MWAELQHDDEFKYCQSHGIQLLVKDILMIQHFKDIQAQSIIKAFKKAPLQYAHLKQCQSKSTASLVLSFYSSLHVGAPNIHLSIQFSIIKTLYDVMHYNMSKAKAQAWRNRLYM